MTLDFSYDHIMKIAISEARKSLKENNNGFGAVIFYEDEIIARN